MSAVATRFGAESTAGEVIAGIDLTGQRAVVTGASSGIDTARAGQSNTANVTHLQRHLDPGSMQRLRAAANLRIKTAGQGAATSVLVATAPELEGIGGRYFEDCNEAAVISERSAAAVAPYALDPDNADRLWEVSSRLVNA